MLNNDSFRESQIGNGDPQPFDNQSFASSHSTSAARQLVSEIFSDLGDGGSFDALAVLQQYPEIQQYKPLTLDLIYEELTRRLDNQEPIDTSQFVGKFPVYKQSIRRLVDVEQWLRNNQSQILHSLIEWPTAGQSLLGFRLIEEIGRGGFSRVYLAREEELGNRVVVVKVCSTVVTEAQSLGTLDREKHPHIVSVHSVATDVERGLSIICMPYLGQATLEDVLDEAYGHSTWDDRGIQEPPENGQLIIDAIDRVNLTKNSESAENGAQTFDLGEADQGERKRLARGSYIDGIIDLGAQIADALECSHRLNIIHSDIKPSNVLLAQSGRALLFDFNLAFNEQVNANQVGGTLPYMAPEQLRAVAKVDGPQSLDPRTDLFSFGVLLYQLLSGRCPFEIPDANAKASSALKAELLLRLQEDGPAPLRQLNPRISKSLATLVHRCLQCDPDERPQSAVEIRQVLDAEQSFPRKQSRWIRNHPALTTVALAAIVMSTMGITLALPERDPNAAVNSPIPPPLTIEQEYAAGLQAFDSERFDDAIDHYTRILIEQPEHFDALIQRGRTFIELEDRPDALNLALADFDSALRLQVNDGLANSCLGFAYAKRGLIETHRRREDFERARFAAQVSADSGFLPALNYNNVGYILRENRDLAAARKVLDEALRLEPLLHAAYVNLIDVELAEATNSGSLPDLSNVDKALQTGPHTSELLARAAGTYALAASRVEGDRAFGTQADHDTYINSAVDYYQQSLEAGYPKKNLDNSVRSFKRNFLDIPAVQAIQAPKNTLPVTKSIRLLNPLDHWPAVS